MHDPRERFLIRYAGGFAPLTVARASGAWVETTDGRRILDFTSGQICSTVGHNHPRIAAAIRSSLDEVVHLNSWMLSEPVLALGERLAGLAPDPLDRVMLLNTGSEANEVAVKLAKLATRAIRGRRAGPQLPRPARGQRIDHLLDGTRRVRPARAGLARATRAIRVPLPDPPLRRHLRLHVPGGGVRTRGPAVGRLAVRARRRAGALGGRHHRSSARLLRARARALPRARNAARDGRGADRLRAPRRDVRLRARRHRAGPLGGVEDARRRRPARRHHRPERDRGDGRRQRIPPRDLARLRPAARGGRPRGPRRHRGGGPRRACGRARRPPDAPAARAPAATTSRSARSAAAVCSSGSSWSATATRASPQTRSAPPSPTSACAAGCR